MPNLYTAAAVLSWHSRIHLDALIRKLEQECRDAGDTEGARTCIFALDGKPRARRWCAEQIAYANDRAANG